MSSATLGSDIAKSLPLDVELRIRHLTHPPVPCDPIFSPPPGEQPEPTHFQSQFLAISIRHGDKTDEKSDGDGELLVFGVEVLVYTTSRLTTVFVSKADSTGYLYLLDLPPGTSSLIRNLSTTFLSYLVRTHQRPGVRLVLSLFARSQNQYLFPGSSENTHKHILDDRGLVKWWCRVSDPILRSYMPEDQRQSKDATSTQLTEEHAEGKSPKETENASATAYLIVPGCEILETRAFFPSTFRADDKLSPRWVNAYPLNQINSTPTAPPRCLIPRFPDDPKSRFLIDLDDEITPENQSGRWRSVKTLDQFWEMMAFRQECSAGRLVGFLWMVVNPPGMANSDGIDSGVPQPLPTDKDDLFEEHLDHPASADVLTGQTSAESGEKGDRDPAAKTELRNETQPQQYPPRGVDDKTIVLSHEDYATVTDYLGELDFADKDVALAGTASWLDKLSSISKCEASHGEAVIGQNALSQAAPNSHGQPAPPLSGTNVLDTTLIRKRKRRNTVENATVQSAPEGMGDNRPDGSDAEARKDEAVVDHVSPPQEGSSVAPTVQDAPSAVNVLQPGLIKKKKKT